MHLMSGKYIKSISLLVAIIFSQIGQLVSYSNNDLNMSFNHQNADLILLIENEKGSLTLNPLLFLKNKAEQEDIEIAIQTNGGLNNIQLAEFLSKNNQNLDYLNAFKFATIYVKECEIEGVNHDIAFAQMCLETGYLKFGGSVNIE